MLLTGGKILTDIAENKSPQLSPKDIVSKHVTKSVQILIGNLRGGGRKRAEVSHCDEEEEEGQTGPCNKKGHLLIYFSHSSSCRI